MNLPPRAVAFLRQNLPPAELSRAISLLAQNAVQLLRSIPEPGGALLVSAIASENGRVHTLNLELFPDGHVAGACSIDDDWCLPLIVAAALALDPTPAAPHWKRELDRLLPPETPRHGAPLCLFLATSAAVSAPTQWGENSPRLLARPGTTGSKGTWIKGKAGWDHFRTGGFDADAAHEIDRLLTLFRYSPQARHTSVYSGYYADHPDWISLTDLPGEEVWSALGRIRSAGIPILSYGRTPIPVAFADIPIDHELIAVATDDALEIRTLLSIEGARFDPSTAFFIGEPAAAAALVHNSGIVPETITIHPAATPIPREFQRLSERSEALRIDRTELDSFEQDYLPRLQRAASVRSPDDSYRVTAPPRVTLTLSLAFIAPKLHLSWTWSRPSGASPLDEQVISTAVNAVVGTIEDSILSTSEAALFMTEVLPRLREIDGLVVEETTKAPDFRAAAGLPEISLSTTRDGDWFDLDFTVSIDGEDVDFAELFAVLTLDEPVFVLPDGRFFSLDRPEFTGLRDIIAEARTLVDRPAGEVRVSRYQVDMWAELTELGIVAAQEAEWWLSVQTLGSATVTPIPPSPRLQATLRDYQAHGLSWLHFLRTHGLGGILADDMGLGKTLQTIAMIQLAVEEQPDRAPFLVVAPTSVVGNWEAEVRRFAPELTVQTISSMTSRRGRRLADAAAGADIVVTSYALFRAEAEDYRALTWSGLILDEAQQIKNPASHGHRAARMLGAPFTLVITGTPMENNLLELWSLASLAAPGLLGSKQKFTEYYRTPIEKGRDAERLALLKRRLSPFMLRRTKDLVATELPAKQEQTLTVELHPKHRRAYDVRFQRERQRLLGLVDDVKANRFEIFRSLTLLRQLALDPTLVDAGDAPSAKIDTLIDLLAEAASEGHRVLVLSQFTKFLRRAHDRADAEGISSEYLDGETTNRQSVIDRFRDGEATAFFLSLRAAGFGLNLTEADYVVLLDPWWNPAVEEQAVDRAHRIGQTKPVFVFRLVSADTIEQKVVALRAAKADLFARVFDADGEIGSTGLSADDIRGLLEE